MTVPEGHFLLYSHITPALKAGDYRFEVEQQLTAKKGTSTLAASDLPVDQLDTHVQVTAPRYHLPPDQVLSTFPPAGTEGAYGARLPQIVIKRRTLPWERGLTVPAAGGGQTEVDERTPWLALVLVAEGEAELLLNQDVADCVSRGVTLDGEADVAKANCLVVRQSILEQVLPTRKDVPLLAHAREVDIHDTELMMGDDDGFLAVVIANRLPVPGTDAKGNPVPVKYLACLINLEGQFHRLLPQAPPHRDATSWLTAITTLTVEPAHFDHLASGELLEHFVDPVIDPTGPFAASGAFGRIGGPLAEAADAPLAEQAALAKTVVRSTGTGSASFATQKGYATAAGRGIYAEMAKDFGKLGIHVAEPTFTFPVLLHWSFVSTGDVTFESLMEGLDSGLLGTKPEEPYDETGREPLEVTETGHVGLTHRTRRGDTVRTWYRGPLLPHPSSGERLPLAHAGDQLRAVIPDGREDLSLAAAFEMGRLLALSRPSMVAALLRWRQRHFRAARTQSIWAGAIDALPFPGVLLADDVRRELERKLRDLIVVDPDGMIGPHRPPVGPGDPIDWGADTLELLGRGLGLDVNLGRNLRGLEDLAAVSAKLRDAEPALLDLGRLDRVREGDVVTEHLRGVLDSYAEQVMSNVLAGEIAVDPVLGPTVVRSPELGTVIARRGVGDRIVDLPDGVLDVSGGMDRIVFGGLGVDLPSRAEETDRPRRRRAPRRDASDEAPVAQPDPLDEVLRPRGARRTREDGT